MPYVNIRITKDKATAPQKAAIIKGVTNLLHDILKKNPATTVSATELPPRRLKPCMSQQAASPAANRPFSAGLWPLVPVRTPPIV